MQEYNQYNESIREYSENEINQLCALCLLAMFISGFFYEMFSWIFVTLLFCLFFCILEKNTGQKIFS